MDRTPLYAAFMLLCYLSVKHADEVAPILEMQNRNIEAQVRTLALARLATAMSRAVDRNMPLVGEFHD